MFRPGFELVSPCPFPVMIVITPRAPPYIYNIYIFNQSIGIMIRVFASNPGDRNSIPGRVIPVTKMVLDASLLNTSS